MHMLCHNGQETLEIDRLTGVGDGIANHGRDRSALAFDPEPNILWNGPGRADRRGSRTAGRRSSWWPSTEEVHSSAGFREGWFIGSSLGWKRFTDRGNNSLWISRSLNFKPTKCKSMGWLGGQKWDKMQGFVKKALEISPHMLITLFEANWC